jgi:hypothetical protein
MRKFVLLVCLILPLAACQSSGQQGAPQAPPSQGGGGY